jgi:hypothetical protein
LSNMKRKLFTTLALFSLLFCAATVWWWTLSGNRIDEVTLERHGQQTMHLWGSGGKVMVTRTVHPAEGHAPTSMVSWGSTPMDPKTAGDANISLLSVSFNRQPLSGGKGGEISTLILPAWLIAAVFALPPSLWVAPKFKRKKKGEKPS